LTSGRLGSSRKGGHMNRRLKVEVEIEQITWVCGDCGNVYGYDVKDCPNNMLDVVLLDAHLKGKKR
jgi:uncharacterized OB-fold protein